MPTVLEAIATGNPPHTKSQTDAAAFMQRITSLPDALKSRLPALYERSAIERRYSAVEDYARDDAADFTFYPRDWSLLPAPTTAQRNALYRTAILPLAEDVGRRALEGAGRDPGEVTHVVFATCTGFFAPGPDIELVKRLGLPAATKRTLVGFMGCYAAFNALRVADGFVRADPAAVVLVVCAELCSLHFQTDARLETAVVNALFADGAAAAVVSGRPSADAVAAGALEYLDNATHLDDDSLGDMTWEIGDTGFLMGLSSRVPRVIAKNLPAYLGALLEPHGLAQSDVDFWAIHPGGRAIVEQALETLGLPPDAAAESYSVLRDYGNMSSPTVLFVLQRLMERHRAAKAAGEAGLGHGVALAFGPGLTIEGALLRGI